MKDMSQLFLSPVTVLGAGSWGTALAVQLAQHQHVRLWGRDSTQMQQLQMVRVNDRYLSQIVLPGTIGCTSNLEKAMDSVQDILIAVPSHALPWLFSKLKPFLTKNTHLLLATKGLYPDTSELLSTWLNTLGISYALLSGPSFSNEVAQKLPAGLVVASLDVENINIWRKRLHQPHFQIYPSQDVIGVALCGAMKNVIAVSVGIAEGLALGANACALLLTQGLSEMQQLGSELGACRETFLSPAGIGDLTLTCMNDQSRNRRLGVLIGQGFSVSAAQKQLGLLSEGILTAQAICKLATAKHITLPLCQMVYTTLFTGLHPQEAILSFLNDIASYGSK